MATGTIQQVTNNSGLKYCKMPDGTLLCWDYITLTVAQTDWIEWSGIYYAEVTPDITWDVPFIRSPYVFANVYNGSGWVSAVAGKTTGCVDKFYIYRPNNTATYYAISILAIGRWK